MMPSVSVNADGICLVKTGESPYNRSLSFAFAYDGKVQKIAIFRVFKHYFFNFS